jgi:tetratricopeptide (TPR) repeat protein
MWFVVTLVPVIGLLQVGLQAVADRYTYLPLVGIFVAIAWAGQAAATRPALAAFAALAVLGALGVRSERQVRAWRDDLTLFRQVAAVSPGHWVPHFFLGQVLARQGRFEEAVTEFRVSLAYTKREPVVHLELADALRRLNRLEDAGASYGHALALDRDNAEAHWGLGGALVARGSVDAGIGHLSEAVRLLPTNILYRTSLADALSRRPGAVMPAVPRR